MFHTTAILSCWDSEKWVWMNSWLHLKERIMFVTWVGTFFPPKYEEPVKDIPCRNIALLRIQFPFTEKIKFFKWTLVIFIRLVNYLLQKNVELMECSFLKNCPNCSAILMILFVNYHNINWKYIKKISALLFYLFSPSISLHKIEGVLSWEKREVWDSLISEFLQTSLLWSFVLCNKWVGLRIYPNKYISFSHCSSIKIQIVGMKTFNLDKIKTFLFKFLIERYFFKFAREISRLGGLTVVVGSILKLNQIFILLGSHPQQIKNPYLYQLDKLKEKIEGFFVEFGVQVVVTIQTTPAMDWNQELDLFSEAFRRSPILIFHIQSTFILEQRELYTLPVGKRRRSRVVLIGAQTLEERLNNLQKWQ